jgi:hypothetical protein
MQKYTVGYDIFYPFPCQSTVAWICMDFGLISDRFGLWNILETLWIVCWIVLDRNQWHLFSVLTKLHTTEYLGLYVMYENRGIMSTQKSFLQHCLQSWAQNSHRRVLWTKSGPGCCTIRSFANLYWGSKLSFIHQISEISISFLCMKGDRYPLMQGVFSSGT